MTLIKDLQPTDHVEAFYLVHRVVLGVTNQGKEYMTLYLRDKTGEIDAKLWTIEASDKEQLQPQNIIKVKADIIDYRGKKQMKIIQYRLSTTEDHLSLSQFVETAPMSPEEIEQEIMDYVIEIQNAPLQRITRTLLSKHREAFYKYPAASSFHHDFAGGLSYHVVTMLRIAKYLSEIYPKLNKGLLYSGIILHDMGKIRELTGAVATQYTLEGNLLGHISIMHDEISQTALELGLEDTEEVLLLKHIILSHHGKLEYGSPKLPLIQEAEIIHFIDNIDARMQMFDKHLMKVSEGEYTERIFGLENRSFYKPNISSINFE